MNTDNDAHGDDHTDGPGDLLGGIGERPPMGWGFVLASLGLSPPGFQLVAPAVTPAPALLDGLDDEGSWCESMLRAWASAVVHRYPSRLGHQRIPRGYDRGPKRDAMLVCAHKLFEARIAPVSWAAFAVDRWREGYAPPNLNPRIVPPSPAYVYRAEAMAKALPIYRSHGAGYAGGRVVLGPKYHELHAVWSRLCDGLVRARVQTVEDARAVVARILGPELAVWERAVWAARVEARELQRVLDVEAKEGVYRW